VSIQKPKLLIFTGAGVSAESGIKTFRDHSGLWEKYNVDDVATASAWKRNPALVLEFYNFRRAELQNAKPNQAHFLIAGLEKDFNVTLVTQNVDDLHERAGSTPDKIVHLHGSLISITNPSKTKTWPWPDGHQIKIGDLDEHGNQLRPNIVWFEEMLSDPDLEKAYHAAFTADICLIVGTSMQVFPASGIPWETPDKCQIYYIDPGLINFHIPLDKRHNFHHLHHKASAGLQIFVNQEAPKFI
jgi:NAD-dependent deacetylase